MRSTAALFLALAMALAAPVPAATDEPPARVGRVSWTSGEVAVFLDAEQGWEKGYVNSPLTSENSLWTEPGARAELRIGPTTVRLEEATQLDIRRLDDDELRAHVVRGHITLRIREFDRGERYILSTPRARFAITSAGRYRLDAEETTGEAVLTVFSGSAEVDAGRRATINAGEAVRVREDGEHFDFERIASTSFDNWSNARDERVDRLVAETIRYVSPQMTGYEDLAEHGRWNTEPEYGAVWYPSSVGPDYVPYRNGHWVHARPWGWTWVDYAPWGYAPFHYGRWVYVGNRWGWCPGRYVARPVWAPALVGWVGSSGLSVSVGGTRAPAMGWYPLSPYDNYRPWYTNNTRYINNVNVIVNRSPRGRDHDHDRHRERGATVVLREDFVRQRPVTQGITRVSGEAVREAVRGAPVAANPVQVLPPRTEAQRPRGAFPGQQAGAPAATRPNPASTPAPQAAVPGAPAAPRVTPPAVPQFTPAAPRTVAPTATRPDAPAAPRGGQPQPAQPQPAQPQPQAAPPAPRPSYRGEPARERQVQQPAPAQPVQSVPAPRGRPVELREAPPRVTPVPQPAPQAAPAAPRAQPQPQAAPEAPAAPRAQPQPAKPEKPEKEDKPEKPEKPEKPGRVR